MRTRSCTDDARWPAAAFAGLPEATARLRGYILGLVREDGAVRDPCRSRILESALALRLLEKTEPDSLLAHSLRQFLTTARPVDPFEHALAQCALRRSPGLDIRTGTTVVTRAPGFTGARKCAFVQALACLWGAGAPGGTEFGEAFSLAGLHSWARVQVTAVKVILAASSARNEVISDEEVLLLLSTQRLARVWEGNILLHLLVLHALALLPGTERVIAEGMCKLRLHQRSDGGMPFVIDLDTWCSVTGGLALACAGAPAAPLAKVARHLLEQQRPGGGWTGTDAADQTDVDDTSVAVEFLHLLAPDVYGESIRRGILSMLATRGADGGFPTYLTGAPSEAGMTAAVINALSTDAAAYRNEIHTGLRFLVESQNSDGSFPPAWSASGTYGVFRALLAAHAETGSRTAETDRMISRALTFVRERQHPDGGWGQRDDAASDPLSTAYALIALTCQNDPSPAARGFAYLRAHQSANGRIDSPPDVVGPRPFILEIPALASIFSLLALSHLDTRTTPATPHDAVLCANQPSESARADA